jgi:hypothetical protein
MFSKHVHVRERAQDAAASQEKFVSLKDGSYQIKLNQINGFKTSIREEEGKKSIWNIKIFTDAKSGIGEINLSYNDKSLYIKDLLKISPAQNNTKFLVLESNTIKPITKLINKQFTIPVGGKSVKDAEKALADIMSQYKQEAHLSDDFSIKLDGYNIEDGFNTKEEASNWINEFGDLNKIYEIKEVYYKELKENNIEAEKEIINEKKYDSNIDKIFDIILNKYKKENSYFLEYNTTTSETLCITPKFKSRYDNHNTELYLSDLKNFLSNDYLMYAKMVSENNINLQLIFNLTIEYYDIDGNKTFKEMKNQIQDSFVFKIKDIKFDYVRIMLNLTIDGFYTEDFNIKQDELINYNPGDNSDVFDKTFNNSYKMTRTRFDQLKHISLDFKENIQSRSIDLHKKMMKISVF